MEAGIKGVKEEAEPDNSKMREWALASCRRREEISLRRRESSDKREEVFFEEKRN